VDDANPSWKKIQDEKRKEEERSQRQQLKQYSSYTLRYNKELQHQRELLKRLPENLRREGQVAIGLHQIGEHQKALNKLQWIADAQRKNGVPKDEATTLTLLASIYNSLGHYAKALESCEQALAMQKKISDREGANMSLHYQGLVYQNLGQYSKALNSYQQALTIAKESSDKLNEGRILVDIGNVRVRQGEYSQAIELYDKSLTIINQIRDQQQAIESSKDIVSKVVYNLEKGNVISFQELNPVIYKEDRIQEGQALSGMGEAYQKLGKYSQAIKLYEKALDVHKQINNRPEESATLRKIGTVYVNQGNYSQGLDYYQQALKIAKETDDKAEEGTSLNNIGFIYNTLGKYLDAEKKLLAAVEIWESLRGGLTDDQKVSIFENQASSYQFLQQSLVAQNKLKPALEIAERGRARAFVDLLHSRLSLDSKNQIAIKPPNINQIQQIAQQYSSTIVQYSIINAPLTEQGKEGTRPSLLYIWVVKPTGEITFKQVDLKSSLNISFVDLVGQSRHSIGTRGRGIAVIPDDTSAKNQRQKSLQQLYQILIKPIASELPQSPNEYVIFVPQGELFFLPFAALQDEEGKYLIEKHTILTTPAIQVLQLTHQHKIENVKAKTTKRPLVVGNPTMPSVAQGVGEQPQQLSSLPGAQKEALQIAQTLNTQSLTGSSATETIVKRLMVSAGIVHLATHGLLDDFKESGIPGAIALAPSDKDDGLLTSNEIFDMKLNADLVVLSACDTGRGDIKGDGVIGLSRSFIAAGVPSVIVSLWAVSDNSTAFLMTNFYQNLQQNPNKATALRSAMLTTMKKYPEPLNWAAFTLIGDRE
jgi:CHAT domain-containing protein/Flp pilus assembly protein TadD